MGINGLNKQICELETEVELLKGHTGGGVKYKPPMSSPRRCGAESAVETMLNNEVRELERKNEVCRKRVHQLECKVKTLRMELDNSEKENKSLKQKINDFVLVFVDPKKDNNL